MQDSCQEELSGWRRPDPAWEYAKKIGDISVDQDEWNKLWVRVSYDNGDFGSVRISKEQAPDLIYILNEWLQGPADE